MPPAFAKYTLEDLDILMKQESYLEALNHIKDIPPSQRDARWNQILIDASFKQAQVLGKSDTCSRVSTSLRPLPKPIRF